MRVADDVSARYRQFEADVLDALHGLRATARLPLYEPTTVEGALIWAMAQMYDGWTVDYFVEHSGMDHVLWLRKWGKSFQVEQPTWDRVKADADDWRIEDRT